MTPDDLRNALNASTAEERAMAEAIITALEDGVSRSGIGYGVAEKALDVMRALDERGFTIVPSRLLEEAARSIRDIAEKMRPSTST